MGTMSYIVGSIISQAMLAFFLFPSWGLPAWQPLFALLGGFSFFAGGVCEVSHLRSAHHGTPLGSSAAWMNCVGGLCFFVGGAVEYFAHHHLDFIHFFT